ncbi:MAG: hypothetical protein EZS28_008907 [Streblomastix strix]|uniref:Uncharacterized protein n=1 Tax=Streblomastix strix TaxID=222440 RepID=A0A5J4WKI7_9EUKA|nr:MAG: hypothetical protein EZS28_008907 [Streblomastix strix]
MSISSSQSVFSGFHDGSQRMHLVADVRVRPTPPTRVERRSTEGYYYKEEDEEEEYDDEYDYKEEEYQGEDYYYYQKD